jgi:hypothetical protein
LVELGAAVRRLAHLREVEVTIKDGWADFLLPQV